MPIPDEQQLRIDMPEQPNSDSVEPAPQALNCLHASNRLTPVLWNQRCRQRIQRRINGTDCSINRGGGRINRRIWFALTDSAFHTPTLTAECDNLAPKPQLRRDFLEENAIQSGSRCRAAQSLPQTSPSMDSRMRSA